MGYRVFTDSQGTDWQAWDVVPQLAERRSAERRRASAPVRPASVVVERRHANRRILVGRRPLLSAGLDGGWLCFEASAQKRRLTPIPADWMRCDDECLERYCRQAKPALRSSVPVDISTLDESVN